MVTVVECEPPLVPVMVTVAGPTGVLVSAVIVSVAVADPFAGGWTELISKEQVALFGQPETTRLTALLKPPMEVTVMVDWTEAPPCTAVTDDGLADIEKSGGGGA